jgi:hypothetical protein
MSPYVKMCLLQQPEQRRKKIKDAYFAEALTLEEFEDEQERIRACLRRVGVSA